MRRGFEVVEYRRSNDGNEVATVGGSQKFQGAAICDTPKPIGVNAGNLLNHVISNDYTPDYCMIPYVLNIVLNRWTRVLHKREDSTSRSSSCLQQAQRSSALLPA